MATQPPAAEPFALIRVPAKTAVEACAHASLGAAALALLRPEMTPRQFVAQLLRAEQYADAVRFLAAGLGKRDAVWWGCLTVRHLLWAGLPASEQQTLRAAVRWVIDPSEAHRAAAHPFGDLGTPAGALAKAVSWAGGSLVPPPLPPAPPPPALTPRAVASAINLAILPGDGAKIPERYRQAVALGLHVARGHSLWVAA